MKKNANRISLTRGLRSVSKRAVLTGVLVAAGIPVLARAADWPMWGRTPLRNAVCPDKDPPTDWNVKTGKNILWSAALGSKSYGNPIVSNGMVFVGTNNEGARDKTNIADGGVMMAFDANTGKFLFQRYSAKLATGRVNDWPGEGECSTVYTEPGRLWYCTNRCEVVCLDLSPGAIWALVRIDSLGMAGARSMAEERGVPQERIEAVGAELRERGLVADVDGAAVETPAGRALIDQLLAAVRDELAQRITEGTASRPEVDQLLRRLARQLAGERPR